MWNGHAQAPLTENVVAAHHYLIQVENTVLALIKRFEKRRGRLLNLLVWVLGRERNRRIVTSWFVLLLVVARLSVRLPRQIAIHLDHLFHSGEGVACTNCTCL